MDLDAVVGDALAKADGDLVSFDLRLPVYVGSVESGYPLGQLRKACRKHGDTHFEAIGDKGDIHGIRVTIDRRVDAREPVVALNMIARDDGPGLARAIQSALEHVDEIVIGVDGRSDEATRIVAEAYADTVLVFDAASLEMTPEEWDADEIHFAKARNQSRAVVKSPWTLVIDADEIFSCETDLRRFLRHVDATEGDNIGDVLVAVGNFDHTTVDGQRLARTPFRYNSAMHNQLGIKGESARLPDRVLMVLHEGSLRPEAYQEMRAKQRAAGIEKLVEEGKKGNMMALYHAAKHLLGEDADPADERGVALVEDFRLRIPVHDPNHAVERTYLALYTAIHMQQGDDLDRAEMWAVRAILDGPNVDAFVLLGMIAEEQKDLHRALQWYECACASHLPANPQIAIHQLSDRRFADRDRLRNQLMPRTNERVPAQPDWNG